MNEESWLTQADPQQMLRFLVGTDAPRVQDGEAAPHRDRDTQISSRMAVPSPSSGVGRPLASGGDVRGSMPRTW
jgi:hypothetical protein